MVSTRSKTSQTHLEDFEPGKIPPTKSAKAHQAPPKHQPDGSKSAKRKAESNGDELKNKRMKSMPSSKPDSSGSPSILINRSPVLQLWAATVTQFVYPSVEWETCLSAGSAISTICAVAKGRSIGTVAEADDSEEKKQKKKEAKEKAKELDAVHVMQFNLKLKDGLALVATESKGKPGSEGPLKKKFGDKQYETVKSTFEDALHSWKGQKDQLNNEAFSFYERFRPEVSSGQKGWGRKGELKLDVVREVVSR